MTGSRWRFSSQNRRSLSSRALEVALVFTHSTSWSESNILIIAVQNKLTTIPEIELGDMLWSPSTGLYVRRAVFGSLNERNHESAGVGPTKSGSYSCQASRVDMNSIHSTVEEAIDGERSFRLMRSFANSTTDAMWPISGEDTKTSFANCFVVKWLECGCVIVLEFCWLSRSQVLSSFRGVNCGFCEM